MKEQRIILKTRKIIPAVRPISCWAEKIKNPQNPTVTNPRQTLCDRGTAFWVGTDPISKAIPRINAILAMLDPMILPKIRPGDSLFKADMEVNNSGVEVAIDTTVKPTTTGGMPN